MSKKRKTRSQKMLADRRHVLYHPETPVAQISRPTPEKIKIEPGILVNRKKSDTTNETFAYVIADIRKIILISSAVLVTQVVLLFVLGRI